MGVSAVMPRDDVRINLGNHVKEFPCGAIAVAWVTAMAGLIPGLGTSARLGCGQNKNSEKIT